MDLNVDASMMALLLIETWEHHNKLDNESYNEVRNSTSLASQVLASNLLLVNKNCDRWYGVSVPRL